MLQAVGRRPLFAEVQVQSKGSLCGIYGEQGGILTGFSGVLRFSPSAWFHYCSILFHSSTINAV